jgi:branched-chain amino acid transport system permease protein
VADVLACGAVFVAVAALPLLLPINIGTEILIFGIFAMSTNLVIGVAGLYSFGQAAFVGVGGYTAGYLFSEGLVSLPLGLLIAAVSGGLAAGIVGGISIRRAGIYFMMLTFAFNQMVFYLVSTWRSVTGGEDGLAGIKRPPLDLPLVGQIGFDTHIHFYALTALLFLAAMAFLVQATRSPFGFILLSSRENARRTESLGYSVYRAQVLAFVISGAWAGVAGALFGMLYRVMPLDSVHWVSSGYVVFMVLIGGMSSMVGPVLGAAIFIWLQGLFSLFWARWPLLFGLFAIFVVLYLQGGVVELACRISAFFRRRGKAA